jgi:hypothetical protein
LRQYRDKLATRVATSLRQVRAVTIECEDDLVENRFANAGLGASMAQQSEEGQDLRISPTL